LFLWPQNQSRRRYSTSSWLYCYNLGFELSKRHTLVLSNTKLNRVSKYKMSTLYTNYWWSVLHSFSPTLMTMCSSWSQYILTMLYDIIISRIFYIVPSYHMSMRLMWPSSHAYVTCDIMFCLLCLCPNKEKEKDTQK